MPEISRFKEDKHMYVVNGVAYADDLKADAEIEDFKILDRLYMLVTFSGGEKRIFDVEPLLQYPAYRELEKQEVFDTARLNGGTITWLNGAIDVSPEKVYEISYPYEG
ncbi:MAG: DUF2442 domain-containing protein [Anaerovibrio sp.]|uniref:DUF2442 domain-containing protein n=1 Tax=Anaerovibrio TaxID=82373 RepID=UPI002E75C122|nr:DUF2442 domain-containing protein [Anaerovibrio sp.]MBQ2411385.1 DUF2442 domain-containing protein [Selenomonadaceae bacterium]MBQ5586752.1 DUF2442 domain-containing protein [Selenomonadaceae bacterium]MBQ5650753.1 DUF2442 domain-containing protein [Selenomonadaceae bacterium]MBQ5733200.1 DUF2442 domain-containing protein [Selenomonadaceae bacterium]MBR0328943.1 DUF2442 domain-containing protein [Selenomonadaceae bacterium]